MARYLLNPTHPRVLGMNDTVETVDIIRSLQLIIVVPFAILVLIFYLLCKFVISFGVFILRILFRFGESHAELDKQEHDFRLPMITLVFLVTQSFGLMASVQDQVKKYRVEDSQGVADTITIKPTLYFHLAVYAVATLIIIGANMAILRATFNNAGEPNEGKLMFNKSTRFFTAWALLWIFLVSTGTGLAAWFEMIPGQIIRRDLVVFDAPKAKDIVEHTFKTEDSFKSKKGAKVDSSFLVKDILADGLSLPVSIRLNDEFHKKFYIDAVWVFPNEHMKKKEKMDAIQSFFNEDVKTRRTARYEIMDTIPGQRYYLRVFLRPKNLDFKIKVAVTKLKKANSDNRYITYSIFKPSKKNIRE